MDGGEGGKETVGGMLRILDGRSQPRVICWVEIGVIYPCFDLTNVVGLIFAI